MSRFVPTDGRPHSVPGVDESRGGELSLLSLPGVGRSKAQALINAGYHSLRDVADAPIDELKEVPGLGPKTAEQLREAARRSLSDAEPERPRPTVVPLRPDHDRVEDEPVAKSERPSLSAFLDAPSGGSIAPREPPAFEETTDPDQPESATRERFEDTEVEIEEDAIPVGGAADRVAPGLEEEATGAEETRRLDAVPGPDNEPLDVHLSVHIDNNLLAEFDRELAREFEVIPMHRIGDVVLVASESVLDDAQLRELSDRAGMEVRWIPSQVPNIDSTLRTLYDHNSLRSSNKGLGEILIDLGLLSPEQLGQALAHQMRENNPFFQPVLSVDQSLLHVVPEGLARKFNVLPLFKTGDSLLLASSEHLTDEARRELESAVGSKPEFAIVGPSELQEAMTAVYQVRQRYELRQMWLGELLVSRNLITRAELDTCLAAQARSRKKLGQLLIDSGYINEDALYPILAEKLGMEYKRFEHQDIDHQLTYLVSERFAERNLILPLKLDHVAEVLEVVISDPTNLQVRDMLDSVAEAQGATLQLMLSGPQRLKDSISYAYNFNKQMEVDLEDLEIEADADWDGEHDDRHEITITEDLPKMRRIVNKLLYEAVTEGASDIHIENLEARTQVRFRIDGILHERTTPINKSNIQKIISVLKIG